MVTDRAPTIAAPASFADYGVPWQDATKLTGQAVGKAAEAAELVTDLEGRVTRTRQQFGQLDGKTIAGVLPSTEAGGGFFVYGPQDLRSRFFASLGAQVFQGETAAALTFSSVLSIPAALDTVPKQLAGAVG